MKRSRHGIAVSQDNHIKKVDNPDVGAYNYRDGEKVLKKNGSMHFRINVKKTFGFTELNDKFIDR